MPKRIDPAVKERALRLLREHRGPYPSLTAACAAVARQERIGAETLRRWALQSEIDEGTRPGTTSEEHEQIKRGKMSRQRLAADFVQQPIDYVDQPAGFCQKNHDRQ